MAGLKKFWAGGIGLLILLGLLFVWNAATNTHVFRFSEETIENVLQKRAPLTRSYFRVFDVTIDAPRVDLIEKSDRIAAGADVILDIKIGGFETPLQGAADISGSIEYRAEETAFYLADPQIEVLKIPGIPERFSDRAHGVVALAISEFYENRPLYELTGDETPKAAARMLLRDIVVKDGKLVVTLGLDQS